ncbi:hypothetical protein [Acidovorax sp.]|uniref:hypothetical protein n=1 Tax=Acidovorax sp. TaxID=1872122 RepID=UPI00391F17F3
MGCELDFGGVSEAGRENGNENFAARVERRGREPARGAIAAIADGVGAAGNGPEAAQTTVRTLLSD